MEATRARVIALRERNNRARMQLPQSDLVRNSLLSSGDPTSSHRHGTCSVLLRRLCRGISPKTSPTKQEQQMKVQSGGVPRAPPSGDGAGDTDLGSERRRPGAASVGAWSLAEEVRLRRIRGNVGASSTR